MSLPHSCFSLLRSGTVCHHTQLFQNAPNQRSSLGLQLSQSNVCLVWRKPGSLGFTLQHHRNWACWHAPVIPEAGDGKLKVTPCQHSHNSLGHGRLRP